MDARDSLFGTAMCRCDCPLGVRLCISGTVSLLLGLVFVDDDGLGVVDDEACGPADDLDFLSLLAPWLACPLLPPLSSFRGSESFLSGRPFFELLLLLFEADVELEDECPLRRLEDEVLEGVLPKRYDSRSNVRSVSARDALDRSMRDS